MSKFSIIFDISSKPSIFCIVIINMTKYNSA